MTRFGAISGNREALVTGGHQLYRPIEPFCRQCDQRGARRHLTSRAKCPADIGTDHAYLVWLYVERFRDAVLEAVNKLAWLIDRERAVGPCTGRGEQLDRIVVLCRRRIFSIH